MKRYYLLFSCLLFWMCKKETSTTLVFPVDPNLPCDWIETITPPSGFTLEKVSAIEENVNLDDIQMLNDEVGYLLAGNNKGGYAEVYKTVDGGHTWQDLNLIEREIPYGLFFLNEKEGWISYFANQGNILKTIDGGKTWASITFDNLNGHLRDFAQNSKGAIFAMLSGLNVNPSIIKSVDQGKSWELFYEEEPVDFSIFRSGFHLTEQYIYLTTQSGALIKLDFEGNQIAKMPLPIDLLWDVNILDDENFILVGNEEAVKSNNGGQDWEEIHSATARIIQFNHPAEGWMILNKTGCGGDVYQVMDVLAYTEDGGESWQESEMRTNLMIDYNNHYQKENGDFLILFGKSVFELQQ